MKKESIQSIDDEEMLEGLKSLDKDILNGELKITTIEVLGWKEWIPRRFWEVITKRGVNVQRMREIIREELDKQLAGKDGGS